MRVLVFDPTNRAPLYLAHFVAALSKRIQVKVIAPFRNEEKMVSGVNLERLRLFHVPADGLWAFRVYRYMQAWSLLFRFASDFTIVHIQWFPGLERNSLDLRFIKMLLRRNRNVAYTVHNIIPHGFEENTVVHQRYSTLYAIVPLLFVHCRNTKEELVNRFGISAEKIEIVPHGPFFSDVVTLQTKNRQYTAAMIGNISPYKGVEDAIAALALIKLKYPDAQLLIAGRFEKHYKDNLLAYAEKFQVKNNVIMVDRFLSNNEVVQLHLQSMMILLPYHVISQSGAALTAIGLGLPIICYDIGGLSELVVPGYNGFVVQPGDVIGLADRIIDVIQNQQLFTHNAHLFKSRVAALWEENARLTVESYSKLLNRQ